MVQYNKKFIDLDFKDFNVENEEEYIVEAIISTKGVDREGEVVLPEGCNYTEFLKTGTVLFDHDQSKPIAKTLSIRKNSEYITAKFQFSATDSFSQKIYNLIKEGIIKATSIGFIPTKRRKATEKDKKDFGDNCQVVTTQYNLLEFSIVAVPANSEALVLSVKSLLANKKIEENDIKLIFPQINIKEEEYKIPITIKKITKKENNIEDLVNIEIKKAKGKVFYLD